MNFKNNIIIILLSIQFISCSKRQDITGFYRDIQDGSYTFQVIKLDNRYNFIFPKGERLGQFISETESEKLEEYIKALSYSNVDDCKKFESNYEKAGGGTVIIGKGGEWVNILTKSDLSYIETKYGILLNSDKKYLRYVNAFGEKRILEKISEEDIVSSAINDKSIEGPKTDPSLNDFQNMKYNQIKGNWYVNKVYVDKENLTQNEETKVDEDLMSRNAQLIYLELSFEDNGKFKRKDSGLGYEFNGNYSIDESTGVVSLKYLYGNKERNEVYTIINLDNDYLELQTDDKIFDKPIIWKCSKRPSY